jgi:hypothetical protein
MLPNERIGIEKAYYILFGLYLIYNTSFLDITNIKYFFRKSFMQLDNNLFNSD